MEAQLSLYRAQVQAYEAQVRYDPRSPYMHIDDTYTEAASYICIQDWGYYIGGAVYRDITVCRTYDFGPISLPKYKSAAISKTELKENFRKIA